MTFKIYLDPQTWEEVLENRKNWAAFLQSGVKKRKHVLDDGEGNRCCIGHGCFIAEGLERHDAGIQDIDGARISYNGFSYSAPESFVFALQMRSAGGDFDDSFKVEEKFVNERSEVSTLAALNDYTLMESSDIGALIEKMIEGGPGTPFHAKDHFTKIVG
ncbi:hypothetical protein Ab1vBOLIVR5_gp259 [Agrobacterium phage OLIVR5]|uniref:Uncharacterized protein n=1 Tax=Agrobacterium phage OLIVR5 TaxID=2723773 RepID=A0A858MT08_9CAUD|nr:hypothetical protein KNU99_gp142 [Agrobacterium phage OLIVR5]QIW87907.1 hypothetical protein Ab1vBOLIVR5_gp259 [Agrobacterium phage OLIVR5]QIW88172.1 hypothetical protein Ab1vBOLIVR6_gp265 [Agrobacterium phage OLIVR6]